nr:MAG TPA: hypothetical protein [Caudoviricetes sp.]
MQRLNLIYRKLNKKLSVVNILLFFVMVILIIKNLVFQAYYLIIVMKKNYLFLKMIYNLKAIQ